MKPMNMRESSKSHWRSNNSIEHINVGSLQRIADATEKMAMNYNNLLAEKTSAENGRDYWRKRCEKLDRSNSALRGYIKRLKRTMKP